MSIDKSIKVTIDGEELFVKGGFYEVEDWMGEPKRLLGLYLVDKNGEEYGDLSKSFGEFVGQYGCFFADANSVGYDAGKVLQDNLIAFPSAGFKQSGFVKYPSFRISPYAMETLFTLEEIAAYKLDFDCEGEATEEQRTSCEWVKESLANEKKSFDEFLANLQGRS